MPLRLGTYDWVELFYIFPSHHVLWTPACASVHRCIDRSIEYVSSDHHQVRACFNVSDDWPRFGSLRLQLRVSRDPYTFFRLSLYQPTTPKSQYNPQTDSADNNKQKENDNNRNRKKVELSDVWRQSSRWLVTRWLTDGVATKKQILSPRAFFL